MTVSDETAVYRPVAVLDARHMGDYIPTAQPEAPARVVYADWIDYRASLTAVTLRGALTVCQGCGTDTGGATVAHSPRCQEAVA